jgi:adenylate cyclase
MPQPSLKHLKTVAESASSAGAQLLTLRSPAGQLSELLALVVTDLEGFTPLVEALGDRRAQEIIHEHNRIVRACVSRHAGTEVTHLGDGVMAAFRSVHCALLCACDIQLALRQRNLDRPEVPLRARIGIHAGEPLPEETRLFGYCVNTAVRVCSAAPAEGVLVTEVAKLLSQGQHEFGGGNIRALKGIRQPVMLYELDWVKADNRSKPVET